MIRDLMSWRDFDESIYIRNDLMDMWWDKVLNAGCTQV